MVKTNEIGTYDVGTILRVNLKDTYYIHPTDSSVGSESSLSAKPSSKKTDWLGVSVIYGTYAGGRPDCLKLRLEILRDEIGKKVLAVSSSQIKDISVCFND